MGGRPLHPGEHLGASSFSSVADMWHHRVGSTPDSVAMIFRDGGRWTSSTWGEAHARVERLANALLELGLQPEQCCCIFAGTSVEWVLADVAILCAGGVTAAIDASATSEECAYILGDSEATTVFCESEAQVELLRAVRERVPSVKRVVVFRGTASDDGWVETLGAMERAGQAWGAAHPDALSSAHRAITPDRLATLIYTAGTTGERKGVMLTHDAWVYEAEALDALGFVGPADKQFLFLPLAHAFARVLEVTFVRLGIPTVIDGDPSDLLANLAVTHPTVMAAVPRVFARIRSDVLADVDRRGPLAQATFRRALEIGQQVSRLRQEGRRPGAALRLQHAVADRLVLSAVRQKLGGRIRYLVSGGAPLAREVAEFFHACGLLILEGYGLAESGAASCVNRPESFRFGSVGPPLPGCRVKVADDGEILLRSRGVMRGYHRRPEATREALTPDGWLRTGDVGQVLDSGHVVITGRKTELIVTEGGKHVAPSHFEGLLQARCPYVAHVLLHGDRRPYCVALIWLDEHHVAAWARARRLAYADLADLGARPEVVELVQSFVDQVNRELPSFEQVKRIALLTEPLTRESGALTAFGLRRDVVEARHRALLDGLYPPLADELAAR